MLLSLETLRRTGMRVLFAATAIMAAAVVVIDLVNGGGPGVSTLLAIALLLIPVKLIMGQQIGPEARLAMSLSVVALPAVFLFEAQGSHLQIDLHLLFFAAIAMIAILCDWRVIAASTGFVAVHHLLASFLIPAWVFSGGGSLERVIIHAVIISAEAATLMWIVHKLSLLIDAVADQAAERAKLQMAVAEEREARMQEIQVAVTSLQQGLDLLAAGDLTFEIDGDFAPAYAALKTDFNGAVAGLRQLISSVHESSAQIRTGSVEIAQASEDLAHRTETNAASLEKSVSILADIDVLLKATALKAQNTVEQADQTIATVGSGRETAVKAVDAMGRVAASAKAIDSVIEGLDKIAFQTRVLAMNAAVEAGRAGDAGRGFAVVADLVSALAMRAEEEAKTARDQLGVTQSDVAGAVAAVEKVDVALGTIADDVSRVHDLLGAIASDNQVQSAAITDISNSMSSMDRATQQNAAMVEQTSAAARSLTGEVQILTDQAARFRVHRLPGEPSRTASARNGMPSYEALVA